MKREEQLVLFSNPAQARKRAAESADAWEAVRSLRLAGHKVYRAGLNHHSVDGRRIGEKQLVLMAKDILRATRADQK
jgi:hypothetical protein